MEIKRKIMLYLMTNKENNDSLEFENLEQKISSDTDFVHLIQLFFNNNTQMPNNIY